PQLAQHLGCRQIDALIGVESQLLVGVEGVGSLILQTISPQLVNQTDTAPLLRQIDQQAVALARDLRDGAAELVPAIAAQAAQEIAGKAFGMQAGQDRAVARRLADDDCKVLRTAITRAKGDYPGVLGALEGHSGLAYDPQAAG